MPKFFVANQQMQNNQIKIIGEDVKHIKNVLRKKVGEQITICNRENRKDYICEIVKIEEDIQCRILEELESNAEPQTKVTIFQGLPKADKMEWIIQKAVELGVYDITPVEMKRSIVKLADKEKARKVQRWQKIAEVAAKQSGRNRIPKINDVISMKNICNLNAEYDIVIVAYEKEKENKLKYVIEALKTGHKSNLNIALWIGPEGGIEEEEIKKFKEKEAKIVTLGNRILRTETVALNILSILMYELE